VADYLRTGCVIASLTIGAGELIFSSRGGALFGYRLLWFFLLVLLFKWALVFVTARHMVLTGAHPFQRWMELPGPRGCSRWFFLCSLCSAFPFGSASTPAPSAPCSQRWRDDTIAAWRRALRLGPGDARGGHGARVSAAVMRRWNGFQLVTCF